MEKIKTIGANCAFWQKNNKKDMSQNVPLTGLKAPHTTNQSHFI